MHTLQYLYTYVTPGTTQCYYHALSLHSKSCSVLNFRALTKIYYSITIYHQSWNMLWWCFVFASLRVHCMSYLSLLLIYILIYGKNAASCKQFPSLPGFNQDFLISHLFQIPMSVNNVFFFYIPLMIQKHQDKLYAMCMQCIVFFVQTSCGKILTIFHVFHNYLIPTKISV